MPPANTAAEDDYLALAGDTFAFSSTRYGVHQDLPLRARLDRYAAELPDRLRSFGNMDLHAIVTCCSGNHYLQGFDGDLAQCRSAADATGVPVVSTTLAVTGWLRHRGIDTITVASPFPGWLHDLANAYWSSAGLHVPSVLPIVESATGTVAPSAYVVSTDDIVTSVRASPPSGTPVLLIGTGLHTQAALTVLSSEYPGTEFLTSNSCGVHWLRLTKSDPDPLARLE